MKKPSKKEILSDEVKDTEYNALIRLEPTSVFELKARTGTLECYDIISKKIVNIKFTSKSMIYKLLGGYSIIKNQFKKSRLIAIEIDSKGNATVLDDKKLKAVEKKYKKLLNDWTVVHKKSFGIK